MGTNKDNELNPALINSMTPISDWISLDKIYLEEFFLTKAGCADFYKLAMKRYQETRDTEEPIEQLSPKGIALLSSLHSQEEKTTLQPLVASDEKSLIHIIKLVRDAPSGTQVSVIYQATDSRLPDLLFPRHKTVFKLEKRDNELRIVNLDSRSPVFGEITLSWILPEIVHPSCLIRYFSQEILLKPSGDEFIRQQDDYQCGIFAIKDARQLIRDPHFTDKLESIRSRLQKPPVQINIFKIPARYYKTVQSRQFSEYLLPIIGDEVVTQKGNTLRETHEKHKVAHYVTHFSKKYREEVIAFVQTHSPQEVKMATLQFDAGAMTAERLVAIYGTCPARHSIIPPEFSDRKPPRRP